MSYIFTPTTKQELQNVVDDWCRDKEEAENNFGHISNWNTEQIMNMDKLFSGKRNFNDDISRWDVSNVTSMSKMFLNAHSFNQPIGDWNVSKVTNMYSMFNNAQTFNQPIDKWDVSHVTNMDKMFNGAVEFNKSIGNWDVPNVRTMDMMFHNATAYNKSGYLKPQKKSRLVTRPKPVQPDREPTPVQSTSTRTFNFTPYSSPTWRPSQNNASYQRPPGLGGRRKKRKTVKKRKPKKTKKNRTKKRATRKRN